MRLFEPSAVAFPLNRDASQPRFSVTPLILDPVKKKDCVILSQSFNKTGTKRPAEALVL